MREFKRAWTREGRITRVILRTVGVGLLAAVAFMSLRAAWGMYDKLLEATDRERLAQAELQTLRTQKNTIDTQLALLSSSRGVEAQVRDRYGVVRPGEGEIQILAAPEAVDATPAKPDGFWSRLWQALFVW